MAELVDDLLEFSRLGRQSLKISEIDMNVLVQLAIGEIVQDKAQQLNFNVLYYYQDHDKANLYPQVVGYFEKPISAHVINTIMHHPVISTYLSA